jgi:hypothetical protein
MKNTLSGIISKKLNMQLQDMKIGNSYFLIQEKSKHHAKFLKAILLFAEDGELTFEITKREWHKINSRDYNLTDVNSNSRNFIFTDENEALDYFDYLNAFVGEASFIK